MTDTLTQTVLFDSESLSDLTGGTDFTIEDIFGKTLKISNLAATALVKSSSIDIQNIINVGARIDQDSSKAALGADTVKKFDSTQYDLSGDYPPIAAFNALVSLYNILAENYNNKIQYDIDSRCLNAYPTS